MLDAYTYYLKNTNAILHISLKNVFWQSEKLMEMEGLSQCIVGWNCVHFCSVVCI